MKSTLLLFVYIAAIYIGVASATELSMPLGIPKPPDSRLAISDIYDAPGGEREEWIARFGTKVSRQEMLSFYRTALKKAGFKTYSSADKADYAMIAAKRDDDRISITFKNQSDWVEADENEISIKAVYNK